MNTDNVTLNTPCPKCGHPLYGHSIKCDFEVEQEPVRDADGFLRARPSVPCTCDLSGRDVLLNIRDREAKA